MTRGGSTLPCDTLRMAPIFRSAIFFSSRISTARPASLAMASARSAKIVGVSLFVGFKIGGDEAFSDRLRGIRVSGIFAHKKRKILDGARLKITERGSCHFAQRGASKLCALPCSDQQQPSGFKPSRRVNQSKFQRFAG